MIRLINILALFIFSIYASPNLFAQVKYDEGRRIINGVQLLQDYADPLKYYYLPQYPRLATRDDGSFEFLCIKYVGEGDGKNGGLFHALIAFDLPEEEVNQLSTKLEEHVPGAVIAGPVPLLEAFDNSQEAPGGFELVSAVLSDQTDASSFTRSVVTSSHAPLLPGSKVAVAAALNQEGATLLWESMTGPTSDVSVTVHGYYEAVVKGYNAIVTADMETLYNHFSRIENVQEGHYRHQKQKIKDELQRNGLLNVEVFDRSTSASIDAGDMDRVLQVVTDKLTEVMFDADAGWSADPERTQAVEQDQLRGRQRRGWFSRVFRGAKDTPYYTDDQYVLKEREDIRRQTFHLNLSKSSTIKVPLHASGNLGGLYEVFGEDERYFRIVDLNDAAYQKRQVYVQLDGTYIDSFEDLVNFVSVSFRKTYKEHPAVTKELYFNHLDVKEGRTVQELMFPRLGITGADWINYEYRVQWHLRDSDQEMLRLPLDEDEWFQSSDPAIALSPPFDKRVVEIDADRSLFTEAGMATAIVEFATDLAGSPRLMRSVTLRVDDTEPTTQVAVYHDPDAPVAYRVTWHSKRGRTRGPLQLLDTEYLFLVPPDNQAAMEGDE